MVFCLASLPAFAEESVIEENDAAVTAPAEEETIAVTEEEIPSEAEEPVSEPEEVVTEPEVLDLYAATLRDNGIYVTPGEENIAAFTYDGMRYKVEADTPNGVNLKGFEESPEFDSNELEEDADDILQATGEIKVEAAHSGHFGLAASTGRVVYRTNVTKDTIYVFSEWVKMPQGGSISDDGRAFKVNGDDGTTYVVGYNEIGRDIDITDGWQQVIFTFKAPATGLFEMAFDYYGRTSLYMDDIELYEAQLFNNPLSIKSVEAVDGAGNAFDYLSGFSAAGKLTHKTTFYNSDEDDVYYTAIMVLYKNGIMVDCDIQEGCMALVLDEAVSELSVNIPEGEDLSQYRYMVYFISDTDPTVYYGEIPRKTNPYIVNGK